MKTKMLIFISVLLIIGMSLCIHAQDNTHEGLPAGAIARLGKGGINIMRFSPDGTHLAVGTDVCMWLYDVKDGNETPLFTGQGDQVNALTFSQDGNTLVSSGDDSPVIQFWDLKTGEKQHSIELTQQRDSVVSLAIHGSTLISLDSRGNLIYWHADTGKELSVTGNIAKFSAVAFSDDGSTFAVNVNDSKIHLWDVTTSKRKRTLIGHANLFRQQDKEILALAFSPDGEILASGSKDKNVRLWNTQTYTKIDTLREHDEWVTAIAFSDDLRTLATGDTSGEIKIWDLATRKIRTTLKGHKTTINALTFAPDGMSEYSGCLASGSADGTIRFWNPYTGKELITYTKGHTEWVKTVAFSEDDSFLVSAVYNGLVEKWDLTTFRHVSTFSEGQNDTTNSVAFSSDAKFFACISGNAMVVFKSLGSGSHIRGRGQGNLQVWDITTGEECPVPDMQRGPMSAAPAFSPNNNLIAASDYHTIRVWNRNTRNEQFRLSLDEPLFLGQLLFSPDGQILAALPAYRKIQIWDVATQNDITPDINLPANVFAFSPDSTSIATASHDDMHLWKLNASEEDVHTPLKANLFNIKPKPVLTFSPDGKTLIGSERSNLKFIIGSERRNLKMIDVETGNQTVIPSGHTEPIEAIVLSHNGKTLATASMDGTILL
ncbi:PQQ-binding-like beta-propeller repeat protein, partial [Candidatus Poribacteria bacterium]|nr:PQQ-binding-like beta-propeller repeat protein [Candidatus Poribacteria bacterium]